MGSLLKILAGFLCISQLSGFAQAVKWQNTGSFDYTSHLAATPPYPGTAAPMNPVYTAGLIDPVNHSVGGFAWLPSGDLLVLHFGEIEKNSGSLHIIKNLKDASQTITTEMIFKPFDDPLGLQVVNGLIYVHDQKGIWRVEKTPSGSYSKTMLSPRPIAARTGRHPFAFNLDYSNGYLYYSLGTHGYSSPASNPHPGHVYKVDINTGGLEKLSSGMRTPNGLGIKKTTGDVFFSDNQGNWRKATPIFHVQTGAYHGYPAYSSGWTAPRIITPPAVWLPTNSRSAYGAMTRSGTDLHEVESGIYKDHFLMGDNFMGRISRIFFEKINGVYQGANFHFSGTVKGGIQTMIEGPDGALFGGALGHNVGGWNWQGVLGGLTKWTPNKNSILDILTIKSNRAGFDLEFTEPLKTSEIKPESFWVVSYEYNKWSSEYGGAPEDVKKMRINALESSEDRKRVALSIEGLAKGRVYHIFLKSDLQSETGNKIFFPHAWYTLNEISDRSPLMYPLVGTAPVGRALAGFRFDLQGRLLGISNAQSQDFTVKALRPTGRIVLESSTIGRQGKASIRFPEIGVYILQITTPRGIFSKEVTIL